MVEVLSQRVQAHIHVDEVSTNPRNIVAIGSITAVNSFKDREILQSVEPIFYLCPALVDLGVQGNLMVV